MKLFDPALLFFTHLLNNYIALDPNAKQKLAELSGKVAQIRINDTHWEFFIVIQHEQLQLSTEYAGTVNASISGKVATLLQTLKNAGKPTPLDNELTLSGDLEFIQVLKKIFGGIDVDWEEQLSRFTGDVVAHQIGNHFRSIKNFFDKTSSAFTSNITEYLQEESRHLVSPFEMEDFSADVATLRNDVERLQKRIELLSIKQ